MGKLRSTAARVHSGWPRERARYQFGHLAPVDKSRGRTADLSVRLAGAVDPVRRLLWDHKGTFLIGVSLTSLCIWNAQAAMHCGHTDAWVRREAPLTDVALRGNSNLLAVGNIEGRLELRRRSSPTACLRSAEFASTITHLAWSTSGRRLAVGLDGGQVCIAGVQMNRLPQIRSKVRNPAFAHRLAPRLELLRASGPEVSAKR